MTINVTIKFDFFILSVFVHNEHNKMNSIIKIYFYRSAIGEIPQAIDILFHGKIDPVVFNDSKYYFNILTYSAHVDKLNIKSFLEKTFATFNSDDNPLSTQYMQCVIHKNNLHTSMSIGDAISIDDDVYAVRGSGFKKNDKLINAIIYNRIN